MIIQRFGKFTKSVPSKLQAPERALESRLGGDPGAAIGHGPGGSEKVLERAPGEKAKHRKFFKIMSVLIIRKKTRPSGAVLDPGDKPLG
jgi:hypothetical protein